MPNIIKESIHHWKVLLKDRAYVVSLLLGFAVLIGAYLINHFTSVVNDAYVYVSVGDFILDKIPTYNMEFFFTWVMYGLMAICFFYPVLFKPEIVPFGLKTFGLLILLRCGFINLTNIGPPEGFYYDGGIVGGSTLSDLLFRNDLFFSGHTSYPFLGYLLFKESRIRWVLLAGSILMAITVLAMHVHYSIDVFAAFFITYGTYKMSDTIFNKLNLRFQNQLNLYGWKAFQEKIKILKTEREKKKVVFEKVENEIVEENLNKNLKN